MDKKIYLNNRGAELSLKGDFDGAEKAFLEACEISPEDPCVCYNMAMVFLKKKQGSSAVKWFEKAVGYAGKGAADIALDCALACYESSMYEEAEKFYKKAAQAGACGGEYWNRYGVLFFVTERYEKARECFENAVKSAPEHLDAWYNLSDAYDVLGMNDKALEAREEFIRLEKLGK